MVFRFELFTKVWFMHNNQAYEGIIAKRTYEEYILYADYNEGRDKDVVATDIIYFISYSQGTTNFKEWEMNTKVYTDKKTFIDHKIIIK